MDIVSYHQYNTSDKNASGYVFGMYRLTEEGTAKSTANRGNIGGFNALEGIDYNVDERPVRMVSDYRMMSGKIQFIRES